MGQFTQQDPIGIAGGANVYGFASGDPINFADPFGLCTDKKTGKERECMVTWLRKGQTEPDSATMAAAHDLARRADVDLGLWSGRRKAGTNCEGSRHNCGKALDIATVNGFVVRNLSQSSAEAAELIVRVQTTARSMTQVRENFGPAWLGWQGTGYQGTAISLFNLWAGHQNHIHISIHE